MTGEHEHEEDGRLWTTSFDHVLKAVMTAGIFGIFIFVFNTSKEIARMQGNIENLQDNFGRIELTMGDRYRGIDAKRDFEIVDRTLDDHEKRLREQRDMINRLTVQLEETGNARNR
ncbi:MAG: hypothetical protein KDJ77_17270 [Rhodobiaceae bacterium]|nr:hypothetical protein [Rhodobiaceae bacterium]